jgi:hypothetical protein
MYFETSAKTGENVDNAMQALLNKVMERMDKTLDKTMFPIKPATPNEPESEDTNNKCSC